METVIIIVISVAILLGLRDIIAWWSKIGTLVNQNKEIIDLLKKIESKMDNN